MFQRIILAAALIAGGMHATSADALGVGPSPFGFGFQPFGFYQPYGAQYNTSIRTPPYFALNPPVYYGARHARPYGLSPFAAPPMVTPGNDYRSRLRSDFLEPVVPTPGPASLYSAPACLNPYIHTKAATPAIDVAETTPGAMQYNPFVDTETKIAAR